MKEIIRKCRKDDLPKLLELFGNMYQYNPRMTEKEYIEWQYGSKVVGNEGEYNLWLLIRNRQIVSVLGYVPVEFRYGGEIRYGCWPQNWISVGEDFSGIAVLFKMMEECQNLFYIGLSGQAEAILRQLKVPILRKMDRWIGIIDWKVVRKIFKIENMKDKKQLASSQKQLLHLASGKDVSRCQQFDPEEEFLFDGWRNVYGYSRRTGKFLNWRYFDIPRHNYQALRSQNGEFAIYRFETITGTNLKVARILEWNFRGELASQAMALIIKEGIEHGGILLDFFCTATEVGQELENLGFVRETTIHSSVPYLFRPTHYTEGIAVALDLPPHRQEKTIDFDRWYITKGDNDADRIKM